MRLLSELGKLLLDLRTFLSAGSHERDWYLKTRNRTKCWTTVITDTKYYNLHFVFTETLKNNSIHSEKKYFGFYYS